MGHQSSLSTLTDDEIHGKTYEVFGKSPCSSQITLCCDQLKKKNIISIAATGSGKTLSYFMPLCFSPDSIILIVRALNVLRDQFVRKAEKANLSGIAVTGINNNKQTFKVCSILVGYHKMGPYHFCMQYRLKNIESLYLAPKSTWKGTCNSVSLMGCIPDCSLSCRHSAYALK